MGTSGETIVHQMHFHYEPLALTKLLMEIHIEKFFDSKKAKHKSKAHRFAIFEFLRTMADEELESILHVFVEKEGYEEITFENTDHDFNSIYEIVYGLQRFKDLENGFIKKGHAGKGVFDEREKKFYPCDFAGHWETITTIIETQYPHLFNAFGEMSIFKSRDSFEGITRKELDDFILTNFILIGETRQLSNYL
ncbi:hypothetical protein [Lysinibacillus fusiformis]|uniref:hypothetical protein n=1 Tax=Lysinibacillus fusiformis TaxID=28031 RepID=UPI00263AC4FD|nr:hypothetical protein [Lysinibacillus fusiformis]MDC6267742.1 hypothetical protein [Lysinibacillus sphaericus]MDN4967768.1 hypothetical protein [Lysinibacillus fusiformis]MDN4967824.1 hypothetical protein [Lysinibacillus fusiformis]